MAVIAAAAYVRAVAPDARGHAEFSCALEHRVVHAVYRYDSGAAAAVIGEGGVRILYTAEVGLGHKRSAILAQDAQTGSPWE